MNVRTKEQMEEIYNRQCDTVYRVCFLYLKNEQEALDAVQETFLRLFQKNPVFQDQEHEKAWLIRTAINYCKDVQKSFWKRNRSVYEEAAGQKMQYDRMPEEQRLILQTVLGLPPKYKDIVYLHYYEGYSIEEIAKLMHKNASTMRSRLSRAKELLRKELKDNG